MSSLHLYVYADSISFRLLSDANSLQVSSMILCILARDLECSRRRSMGNCTSRVNICIPHDPSTDWRHRRLQHPSEYYIPSQFPIFAHRSTASRLGHQRYHCALHGHGYRAFAHKSDLTTDGVDLQWLRLVLVRAFVVIAFVLIFHTYVAYHLHPTR